MSGSEVVMITGAAGELGSAMSGRLARDGYLVWMIDIDETGLKGASQTLHAAGHSVRSSVVDVADEASVSAFFSEFDAAGLPLKGLVNNAGVYPSTPFEEVTVAQYDWVVAVNQRGYFLMAQGATARMTAGAAMVNITSITTSGGWSGLSTYVQTKSAAIGLTRALARELGPRGIRVSGLSPGAIPTQAERIIADRQRYNEEVLAKQCIKRRGTPDDIASVASFLVSSESAFITGQNIEVDGGWVMS